MSEHLPPPDEGRFPDLEPGDVRLIKPAELVGRIHAQSGPHPARWNELRAYGPTAARFDPHPPPARTHADRAVLYGAVVPTGRDPAAAPVLLACIAETFQDRRVVALSHGSPAFVLFRPSRTLRLLDLTDSDWVARAGGNAAISSGLRSMARSWARAIHHRYPAIDGVHYGSSTVPLCRCVALWERAADAIPDRPALHLPLSHPALRAEIEAYARRLGLLLVG